MPVDVTMPKLSDTMEEGKILKWIKHPGDKVAIGDVIAEVETDKANMELEAYDEGTLAEIRVAEGQAAPVGGVIAVLAAPGEAAIPGKRASAAPAAAAPSPAARAEEPAARAERPAGRTLSPRSIRRPSNRCGRTSPG